MQYLRLTFLCCFLMFVCACAHTGSQKAPGMVFTTEAFKFFKGEFENTDYFRKHKPKSIAVAPFELALNNSLSINFEDENPADIVRRGLYNHISSLPFQDLELYEIDKRLHNAGIDTPEKIYTLLQKNPKKLKSILGVDALVTGQVTHFDRVFVGIFSQIAVGCEVKMWDLNTGKLLWRAKHVSRAAGGGISLTPIGLALDGLAALWNMRGAAMLEQTDNLFREIVSTIELPRSALAAAVAKPKIDLFICLNAKRPFRAGEKVSFRLIGDPGATAYVDLGHFKSGIELAPVPEKIKQAIFSQALEQIEEEYVKTGHELTTELKTAIKELLNKREIYEGTYTVEPGEEAYGLMAKGYLVNSAGGQAIQMDVIHTIDIDGLPPAQVTALKAGSLDNKIELSWARNSEPDIVAYEIWTSFTPLSGYQKAAAVETNKFILDGLTNFQKIYVRIRAIDKAGNEGQFSPYIEAVPLPEPDLYALPQPGPALAGEIKTKILLRAEKGPFLIQSDLIVRPGGVVYIEPGCEIKFLPDTSIQVTGGAIMAYGQKNKEIRLIPASENGVPGSFAGLIFDKAQKAILQHVVIEKAETGIRIKGCAPHISGIKITRCAQAAIYLEDGARPEITDSLISNNQGMGALVMEGEAIAPEIHHNAFVNNEPFQVQSYTPLTIDLSNNYWGSAKLNKEQFLGELVLKPFLKEPPATINQ